jgi:hypothetical protein
MTLVELDSPIELVRTPKVRLLDGFGLARSLQFRRRTPPVHTFVRNAE